MILVPRNWVTVAFLWLSLATVVTPALDPVGSPLADSQGSAFNPFTSDVSLGPTRAATPEATRRNQNVTDGNSGQSNVQICIWLAAASLLPWFAEGRSPDFPAVTPGLGAARLFLLSVQARPPPF